MIGGGALYRGAMSAAYALPIVKNDVLLIVQAMTAAVARNFRMMHSPKKCLSLAVEPEMPLRKYHHKKQPMTVTCKSRSDSNLKRLGQWYWRKCLILKCVFVQFARDSACIANEMKKPGAVHRA